jgi:hypothetical protein
MRSYHPTSASSPSNHSQSGTPPSGAIASQASGAIFRHAAKQRVRTEAAVKIVPVLLTDADESIRLAAAQLAGATQAKETEGALLGTVGDPKAGGKVRAGALRALGDMDSTKIAEAVKIALGDSDRGLLEAARKLAAKVSPDDAVKVNSAVLEKGSIREQQEAMATIAQLPGTEPDRIIGTQLDRLSAGKLPKALWLDVIEAASARSSAAAVKAKLVAWTQARNGPILLLTGASASRAAMRNSVARSSTRKQKPDACAATR